MANNNAFAENLSQLIKKTNDAISTLSGIHESVITDNDVVNINVGDTSIAIPSYNNIIDKVQNIENTVSAFTSGTGAVKLLDGSYRNISVDVLPNTPAKITNINNISSFTISNNWFFEDLMFPQLKVNLDLKDKIDDDADRIVVKRILLDLNEKDVLNFYNTNILNKNLTYPELIELLSITNINYFEDDEILNFPLVENTYYGNFTITDSVIKDGDIYYILDDIYYSINNGNNVAVKNIRLKENDKLKYKETIYNIDSINDNFISVTRTIGFDNLSVGCIVSKYDDPFKHKIISIPIGYNEINCIFLKGVNEKYNIVSNEWSDMISFNTNNLTLDTDSNTTLAMYYNTFVADFGAEWQALAKERTICAYNGIKPDKPVLNVNDFKVVQINKQINAAMDENEVKRVQSSILSLKNSAATIRKTIAKQKNDLISIKDVSTRINHEKMINLNTNMLNNITTEYESNVDYLSSYLNENNIIANNPKYRVRGFFSIPDPKYSFEVNDKKLGKQEVIGFEIKYRYLKLDDTGVPLTTFNFNDKNNNVLSAVFSDWTIYSSTIKERVFNEELGIYEWKAENAADGSEININQIDIPISSGEKVEFCVRSISEAGYPQNPLKSDWSDSIIIEFPENLSASNQLSNILNDVKTEQNNIALNNVLKAAGYYTHIADEMISDTNEASQYHHKSSNILFETKDDNTGEVINNSVESLLKKILSDIKDIKLQLSENETKFAKSSMQVLTMVKYIDNVFEDNNLKADDPSVGTLTDTINKNSYDISDLAARISALEDAK